MEKLLKLLRSVRLLRLALCERLMLVIGEVE